MAKMLKNLSPILIVLLLAVGSFVLYSCGESTDDSTKTVSSIDVQPASATVEVGGTQTFTAYANYSDGSVGGVIATWTVASTLGSVVQIGYSGLFTASAEGTGTVEATYSEVVGSASVTVTISSSESLTTIEVSPSETSLKVGEISVFTASGTSGSGESMSIEPTWTLTGESIGSFTSDGTTASIEANAEGTAYFTCTSGEVSGTSIVTVEGFFVTITVESDTYVDEANPSDSFGSATSLKAGYVDSTAKYYETYLKFPLSSLPSSASLESVILKVYPSSAGESSLQVKQLDGAFTDSTTWGAKPAVGTYLNSGVYTSGSYNSVSSDELTDLVSKWLTGEATNNGIALVQEGTENGTIVILSLENGTNFPILEIEYTN